MENKEQIHGVFLERLIKAARIKLTFEQIKEHGLQTQIANAIKVPTGTVQKWFDKKKKTIPDAEMLFKIYKGLGASPNYLLAIEDKEQSVSHAPAITVGAVDFVDVKEPGINYEEFFKVPLVSGTIAATIGSGVIVDEHVEDWAIIHRKVVGKKKSLIAIRIDKDDGMSMYPILKPGDIVIIDREDNFEINPKAIYAVRSDNSCTVKRLQRAGRYLLLLSENRGSGYEPKAIDLESNEHPIIGRVLWCSKVL